MKIISLQAENVKKLVAVEIRPDGNLVQITGRNGQGKTSVLDSIWWALCGASHIQSAPIRKGANEARIKLDLGELKVTRTFRLNAEGEPATSIVVENGQGARFPSPQKMLDALLGELSFDPLAFARKDAKEQLDALKRFVPGVDFEAIANADRGDRERRTELGRFAKQERAAAQSIMTPADTPEQPIDEAALVEQLASIGRENAALEQRRANRERLGGEAVTLKNRAEEQRLEAEELREQAAGLDASRIVNLDRAAEIDKKIADAGELPPPESTDVIQARIAAARLTNANVRKLDERMRHHTRADELDKQIETLNASIAKRQAEKDAAIAAVEMPVPGIGFGDGGILLNGLPFDQASDAEQLRASVAIAMALNPKLRVIRIRDGSLLDDQAMAVLADTARDKDFQVWIERVDSTGNVGFVLEDGHVRAAAAEQVAEENAA